MTNGAQQKGTLPVALITGGTDGLGRAAAVVLAENGYRVFAAGRSAERRTALDQLARERTLPLETLELDVTSDASAECAVGAVREKAGPVDVLINCAGIAIVSAMEEVTMEDLHLQFEANYFGAVRMVQRVLPDMRARKGGWIVNMSSISGKMTSPLFGPYSASKFALEAMSDALRNEVFPFGIEVVVIEPGFIPTGMSRAAAQLSSRYAAGAAASPYRAIFENFRKRWEEATAGADVTPEDCARLILKILRSKAPRPRYAVTKRAKRMIALRRVLSDRLFDRQLRKLYGMQRAR